MCTILLAWRVFEGTPVAVAANRDESPGRPSSPPAVTGADPRILAPRDERAGGTWMGVNDRGLFVTVANRWTQRDRPGERSRGLLVDDLLQSDSAAAAEGVLRSATDAADYEGFAMLLADAEDASVVVWDGDLRWRAVEPGVHVLVNVGFDGDYAVPDRRAEAGRAQATTADRLHAAADPERDETAADWLGRMGGLLGDHDYGACRHHDRYRTVSASLVAVNADGTVDWRYADGPPCTTPFRAIDVSP